MHDCCWCGHRTYPPTFCNDECEEEYNKFCDKFSDFLGFLTDHS